MDSHKKGSGRHVDQFGKSGFSGTDEKTSRTEIESTSGNIGRQSVSAAYPGKTYKGGSTVKVHKI